MNLTIKNRLDLPNLFPEKGTLLEQTIVKDILEKIALTQEEIVRVNLKQLENRLTWDADKTIDKTVEFSTLELNFIKKRIDTLDKEGNITQSFVELSQLLNAPSSPQSPSSE